MLRILAIVLAMIGLVSFAEGQGDENNLIVKKSPLGVTETVDRLSAEIEAHGGRIVATLEQGSEDAAALAEAQANAGILVIFDHPHLHHNLTAINARIGMEMPFRIFVSRQDGQTTMTYIRPGFIARKHDINPSQPSVVETNRFFNMVTRSLRDEVPVHYAQAR